MDSDIEVEDEVEIFFVHYLRENRKFSDLKDLKTQITIDIDSAKSALNVCKVYPRG